MLTYIMKEKFKKSFNIHKFIIQLKISYNNPALNFNYYKILT